MESEVELLLKALQQSLVESEARENALRAELEEVKKDNLRLAEENLQLHARLSALIINPETAINKGELQKVQPQNPQKVTKGRVMRPIGSNANLSKVNNHNIGWFD